MASPSSRPDATPDPLRQHLKEVRRGLLRLHKALIDSERAVFEARSGTMTNGQFLQSLLQDPFFAWLRPFSGLIAQIDEALAADDGVAPPTARRFIEQVQVLIRPASPDVGEARYETVRARDPDVLFAHVQLSQRLAGAAQIGPREA